MARTSRLDREIEVATGDVELARMNLQIAQTVHDALVRANGERAAPAVKRTRKAKGLPKEEHKA